MVTEDFGPDPHYPKKAGFCKRMMSELLKSACEVSKRPDPNFIDNSYSTGLAPGVLQAMSAPR